MFSKVITYDSNGREKIFLCMISKVITYNPITFMGIFYPFMGIFYPYSTLNSTHILPISTHILPIFGQILPIFWQKVANFVPNGRIIKRHDFGLNLEPFWPYSTHFVPILPIFYPFCPDSMDYAPNPYICSTHAKPLL